MVKGRLPAKERVGKREKERGRPNNRIRRGSKVEELESGRRDMKMSSCKA